MKTDRPRTTTYVRRRLALTVCRTYRPVRLQPSSFPSQILKVALLAGLYVCTDGYVCHVWWEQWVGGVMKMPARPRDSVLWSGLPTGFHPN